MDFFPPIMKVANPVLIRSATSEDEDKQLRRERNREHARMSRRRKKEKMGMYEETIVSMQKEKNQLQSFIESRLGEGGGGSLVVGEAAKDPGSVWRNAVAAADAAGQAAYAAAIAFMPDKKIDIKFPSKMCTESKVIDRRYARAATLKREERKERNRHYARATRSKKKAQMEVFEKSVESLQREKERLMDFIHSNKLLGCGTTVGGGGIAAGGKEEEVRKLVNDFIFIKARSGEGSSNSSDAEAVATEEMDHSDKSNDGDGGGYYIYDEKEEEEEQEERTMTKTTSNNVLFADHSAAPDRFVETRTEPGSNGSDHNSNSRTAAEVKAQDKIVSVFDSIDLEPLVCPRCGEQNIPIMSFVCPHSICLGCLRQLNDNGGGKEESQWLCCPICRAPGAFCAADTGRRVNLKASQLMETAVALRMKLSCAEEAHKEVEAQWKNEMKAMQQRHEIAMLEKEEEIKRLAPITYNEHS